MDDLGAPLALGFRLFGDGAHHGLVDIDMLDLDIGDLDAPGVGLGVQRLLDIQIERFPLGQHLVQFVLAQYRTQRGL